jgi:predicted transcriptional regulator
MRKISDFKPAEQGLNKILGPLEHEVMSIIWNKDDEVTVRDVFDALNQVKDIAYTTVMTIMSRLATKQLLSKRKSGKTMYYTAAISEAMFTGEAVGSVIDSLMEDFADEAMAHFVAKVNKGDAEVIAQLRALLDEHDNGDEYE